MTTQEWEWELVTKRVEHMPSNIRIAMGGNTSLGKSDILDHLHKRDPTGARIVNMQMNYLRFFRSEANRMTI